MAILGNLQVEPLPKTHIVGEIYFTPKYSSYCVNIFNPSGDKTIMKFKEKEECKTFIASRKKLYSVTIYEDNSEIRETKYFYSDTDAREFIAEFELQEREKIQKKKEYLENENISFLDKYVKDLDENSELKKYEGEMDDETKKKQHLEEFKAKETIFKNKAKVFLYSVAQFYLKKHIIKEDHYVAFKLQTEETRLSEILMHVDVVKKAVFKLSEKIELDKASSKDFDSLASLIRLANDLTKYQHEFLKEVETVVRQAKTELDEEQTNNYNSAESTEYEEVSNSGLITTRDKNKMIKEISLLIEEQKINPIKIPVSPNPKLQTEADDLNEIANIHTENYTSEDVNESSGISSYEDEVE